MELHERSRVPWPQEEAYDEPKLHFCHHCGPYDGKYSLTSLAMHLGAAHPTHNQHYDFADYVAYVEAFLLQSKPSEDEFKRYLARRLFVREFAREENEMHRQQWEETHFTKRGLRVPGQ